MSDDLNQVLDANQRYSQSLGEKSKLALPPARCFALLAWHVLIPPSSPDLPKATPT